MASLFAITSQAQVLNESFESWPAQGWSSNPSEGEKVWTQSPEDCSGYFRGPGKAYDGTHAALLNVATIPLNTPVDLISPNFDVSDMRTPELRFAYAYYRTGADPFCIEVFAGSEKAGTMEYEKIADIVPPLENKGWNEFSRVLPRDTENVMFRAIKNVGASSATLYIDAVSLSNGPDVAPPTDLESSPVVGHDGEINILWRVPNEENSWIVKLSKNELDPSSDRAEIEKTVQGKPEVTVEGLDPGMEYHLYVQTVDGEKRSSWSHRRIMVDYAPVMLPAAFDFDNDSNGFLFIQDNQRNGWSQGCAATGGEGGALYISGDNGETYGYDCVTSYSYAYRDFAMPDEMENGATLSFDFRGMGSNPNHAMKVFLTDNLAIYPEAGKFFRNGKQIGENYCGREDWTKCKIEIPSSYAGKHVRLILFWYNNNSSAQYATPPAAVDNLKFEKSLVMTPNELILSDPTTSTVDIEWNEQGNADNWRLQYKPYNASDDVITTVEVSQTPQYTAGGLDDCTQYSFRVCAVKGDNVSDFTDWMTIATKSLDKTAPYYSGFDDIEGGMFPAGWSYSTNFTGGDVSIGINDAVYHSAPNSVMLYARTDRDEQTLITPPFADLSDHDKRITFYARIDPLQTLTVGVMSDPDDPSTFKPVKKYYGSDYVTFNGIVNVAENHRHILNLDSNDITPEHKYIAFRAGTGFQCFVIIDDFVYEYIPVIKEPVDIRLLDATDESARIHWNAGSEEKNGK